MTRCALYRHFDAEGRLLWVGVSASPLQRLAVHGGASHWFPSIAAVTLEWHDSRAEAEAAEARAIREERPLHNIVAGRGGPRTGHKYGPRRVPDTALGKWLHATGTTTGRAGTLFGVSRNYVSELAHGTSTPGLALAAKIETMTAGAVPASSWAMEPIAAE